MRPPSRSPAPGDIAATCIGGPVLRHGARHVRIRRTSVHAGTHDRIQPPGCTKSKEGSGHLLAGGYAVTHITANGPDVLVADRTTALKLYEVGLALNWSVLGYLHRGRTSPSGAGPVLDHWSIPYCSQRGGVFKGLRVSAHPCPLASGRRSAARYPARGLRSWPKTFRPAWWSGGAGAMALERGSVLGCKAPGAGSDHSRRLLPVPN